MPLFEKLLKLPKSHEARGSPGDETLGHEEDSRSAFWLGSDQVRILLFRECEWRGRKLLFDSVTIEKQRCRNKANPSHQCNIKRKSSDTVSFTSSRDLEKKRITEDDISLLSEMVFGTVAMTYRGSSFKIHSIDSAPCIMCTKIFPATEHNTCKQSERVSDEGLGRSINFDSNSSIRSFLSQPSSGNFSGSDVTSCVRKSSTCSSTGSGWDIEIPQMSSSQSLESRGSSSIGSLSSLRRRWFRVMSTSLSKSDSDETFGMQHWPENGCESKDTLGKRHKTRLGLTMLVRLTKGHERKIEARLLEHMALLEGMLDRIRYSCIEAINVNGETNSKTILLAERLYRSSSRFVTSVLRLLMDINENARVATPLLWHDVLLNSVNIEKTSILHRSLQQMCHLLDELDTKSTNFFLSTVVTAVLTYHLGWIYTVLPLQERQMMEKMGNWYPCNPLWAQLGDLHGALGNPVKVAHTVIAGDPRKSELINSVLSFLSYFIRSGLVRKRRETRHSKEQDVEDATNVLEQARLKRPHLFNQFKTINFPTDRDLARCKREPRASRQKIPEARSLETEVGGIASEVQTSCLPYTMERLDRNRSISPLKRSSTTRTNLDSLMLKPSESEFHEKLVAPELPSAASDSERYELREDSDKNWPSSKVKIIVSESRDIDEMKPEQQEDTESSLQNLAKKFEYDDPGNIPILKFDGPDTREGIHYDTLKVHGESYGYELDRDSEERNKESEVRFMLGDEEKSVKTLSRKRLGYNCQCSYTFSRVPSTSAQLPEDVLRKIIQRNFPESSKNIQPPSGEASSAASGSMGLCQKCNGLGFVNSQNYDAYKQVLETPTNATEVLRTCGSTVGDGTVRLSRSNSLEALMEANGVVELPMPRSKKLERRGLDDDTGFTRTLLQTRLPKDNADSSSLLDSNYTWGLVLQGLLKKKKRRKKTVSDIREKSETHEGSVEKDWWYCMREECFAEVRFPVIDQPIAEGICILADLDTWHVGILSNNTPSHCPPLPVGMSRLVSNMLEAFSYVWRKYHSPSHCIGILEAKLREMWLQSEALAEMLMAVEICDANVANVTNALDLEAADIPLLLAVATAHTPEIAQRFGLTLT